MCWLSYICVYTLFGLSVTLPVCARVVNHSFLFLCVCVPCELRYYPLYSSLSLSHADPILLPRNHTTCTRRSSCILSFIPHHFNTRLHTTVRLQFPSGSISRNIWFFEPDLLTSEIFFWISSHFKNLVSWALLLTIVSHLWAWVSSHVPAPTFTRRCIWSSFLHVRACS